jgi:hypothetical protein
LSAAAQVLLDIRCRSALDQNVGRRGVVKAVHLFSTLGSLATVLFVAAVLSGLQAQAAPAITSSVLLEASNRDSAKSWSISEGTPANDMDDDDDSDGMDLNGPSECLPEGMDIQTPEAPGPISCGAAASGHALEAPGPHRGPVLRRRIFKKSW